MAYYSYRVQVNEDNVELVRAVFNDNGTLQQTEPVSVNAGTVGQLRDLVCEMLAGCDEPPLPQPSQFEQLREQARLLDDAIKQVTVPLLIVGRQLTSDEQRTLDGLTALSDTITATLETLPATG